MPTYITYNTTSEDDSITIYISDSLVIGVCNREDLNALAKIEEVQKPGIYILIDQNRRYVGQAVSGVHNRLDAHNKNKDWWSTLIFLTHNYGALSPDKLNYLEAKLISEFKNKGFVMDNGNNGITSSYIATPQKIEAESFLSRALEGLQEIAHIDLYKKNNIRGKNTSSATSPSILEKVAEVQASSKKLAENTYRYTVTDNLNHCVKANHSSGDKNFFISYLKELVKNPALESQLRSIVKDISLSNTLTESEQDPRIGSSDTWLEIAPNLWAYKNLNRFEAEQKLYHVANKMNLKVKFYDSKPPEESALSESMKEWRAKAEEQLVQDGLFTLPKKEKSKRGGKSPERGRIFDSNGRSVAEKSLKQSYVNYWTLVAQDSDKLQQMQRLAQDESFRPLSSYARIGVSQSVLSQEIASGVYLETNLSSKGRQKYLTELAQALGLDTQIELFSERETNEAR